MGVVSFLGNDATLAPDGIDVEGEIADESIGPQQTTNFIVRVKNRSATSVPNCTVFTEVLAGDVKVFPDNVGIVQLVSGETEEVTFLVQNPTDDVQTAYTFQVRLEYAFITYTSMHNFVRP